MKKLGKKFSFLTKIMLVVGLLISNLSSLSVVFASEVTLDVAVVEDKLNIKYLDELAEDVEKVRLNVYEKITYLDSEYDKVVSNLDLTPEELAMLVSSEEDEMLVVDTLLPSVIFDGIYNVVVEIVDMTDETDIDGEVIDSREVIIEVLHKSGLEVSVFDANTNLEIEKLEDGRYPVESDSSKVNVVAKVLAGGLKPSDMFSYDENEPVSAEELLELPFGDELDLAGYLYGDYTLPVEVKLLDSNQEEVIYSEEVRFLYEEYLMNAMELNMAAATDELELIDSYVFYGEDKDGVVYVLLNEEKTNTMLDLYKIVELAYGDSEIVSYSLSNSEYEDVLASYEELVALNETTGTETVSLEEYLEAIILDDTAMLSLANEGLTVTYKVVVAGDLNSDNKLTEEDLLELINQVVNESEDNLDKSDLYPDEDETDDKINLLDVMYLDQVMKNESWYINLIEEEATLDARLDVVEDDIVSGDEFTVNYVLTLTDYAVNGVSGIFNYDSTMVELVSVETMDTWLGNHNDGMFLYLGTDSLTGTEVEGEEEITYEPTEYVVVTATFKALMSGTTSISVDAPEYFDQATYLLVEETEISTEVVINESDNNNLKSLTVGGQTIELTEDVLDYEITVKNEVTTIEVDAMPEIEGVTAISIISPEELVEGENTITITVVSESGNEKVYTVKVIREEAPKEENTQINYNNYYNDYEEEEKVEVVTPEVEEPIEEEEEPTEEESNLSRIIIIILILLVIAGLVYLIFKDEDDAETRKTNKEINKLKKDDKEFVKKTNDNKQKNNGNKKNKKK